MSDLAFLEDGPVDGPRILLAHGAGAAMDSPFMATLASRLADEGLRVLRFEFPYMHRRRTGTTKPPPDREPVLLETWRTAIAAAGGGPAVVIGGKSMGGRMATLVADGEHVRGVVCFGFPFHAPGRPPGARIDHLATIRTPIHILQGTRDPFGRPDEVAGYGLSPAVAVEWLDTGDHDLKPLRTSGVSHDDYITRAANSAAAFVAGLPPPSAAIAPG